MRGCDRPPGNDARRRFRMRTADVRVEWRVGLRRACDEGRHDVAGVAIEVIAGSVIARGGAGVSVTSGDLDITQRDAGVQGGTFQQQHRRKESPATPLRSCLMAFRRARSTGQGQTQVRSTSNKRCRGARSLVPGSPEWRRPTDTDRGLPRVYPARGSKCFVSRTLPMPSKTVTLAGRDASTAAIKIPNGESTSRRVSPSSSVT